MAYERLKIYEQLEIVMNKDIPADEKEYDILSYLKDIVTYNAMIAEWEKITTPTNLPANIKELQTQIKNNKDE
jgi:hypothetical protein